MKKKHLEHMTPHDVADLIAAIGDAYFDNGQIHNPDIGHNRRSFASLVRESSLHNLEHRFPTQCVRDGNAFHIQLERCRITIYKLPSGVDAEDYRLDGNSGVQARILENNQLSLFSFTMNDVAQPVEIAEVIVIHYGTPEDGMRKVYIGAPISESRTEDGWLWLEPVYDHEADGGFMGSNITPQPPTPTPPPSFKQMAPPVYELGVEAEEAENEENTEQ